MFTKKFSRKILAASLAVGAFTFTPNFYNFDLMPVVQAEIKTYTGVGACVQGDLITIAQAKNYAKLRAEINAKEQAGVYLRGYSKMQNFNLTENKIEVITNSIINIVGDVQYKTETEMIGDSPVVRYVATLQANIDTNGINAYIQRQEKNILEIQSANKEIKVSLDKIDNLIERYNKATSQAEKNKIRAEFSQSDRKVLAGQKLYEGNEYFDNSNYQKAIELYNEALAFNPNYVEAYNNRGNIYCLWNQYDAAIADYNKAIQLNPNTSQAYGNRGNIYFFWRKYDKAIADFNKVLQLNPNDALAYNNLGLVYKALKQYDKSITAYNKAIQINSNFALAYYNRGITYKTLKQYDVAIADYTRAIELNPNYPEAYNNRGIVYKNLNYYDKAIADYNKALQINPNLFDAYNNRGNAYKNLKQYQKAIEDYTKYIQFNSKFMWAYKNRGDCYQALGETEKANADFAKARELGFRN